MRITCNCHIPVESPTYLFIIYSKNSRRSYTILVRCKIRFMFIPKFNVTPQSTNFVTQTWLCKNYIYKSLKNHQILSISDQNPYTAINSSSPFNPFLSDYLRCGICKDNFSQPRKSVAARYPASRTSSMSRSSRPCPSGPTTAAFPSP